MPTNDVQTQVFVLTSQHQWVALAALLIGVLLRALRLPVTPAPLNRIPKAWLPAVGAALGAASAVLESVMHGVPWQSAALGGVTSAAVGFWAHELMPGSASTPAPAVAPPPTPPEQP